MSETKISQRTAILLEHARNCGLQGEELLNAIRSGKIESFQLAQNGHFDYAELFSYAEEHGEELEKAAAAGYRITFNTKNGLKIWLEETFQLSSESDFFVGEGIIENLHLQEEQVAKLKQTLAVNWTIAEITPNARGYNLKLTLRGLQH